MPGVYKLDMVRMRVDRTVSLKHADELANVQYRRCVD